MDLNGIFNALADENLLRAGQFETAFAAAGLEQAPKAGKEALTFKEFEALCKYDNSSSLREQLRAALEALAENGTIDAPRLRYFLFAFSKLEQTEIDDILRECGSCPFSVDAVVAVCCPK